MSVLSLFPSISRRYSSQSRRKRNENEIQKYILFSFFGTMTWIENKNYFIQKEFPKWVKQKKENKRRGSWGGWPEKPSKIHFEWQRPVYVISFHFISFRYEWFRSILFSSIRFDSIRFGLFIQWIFFVLNSSKCY